MLDLTAPYYVYILASRPYGTLYTGFTNAIIRRVWQHKSKTIPGFSRDHGVDKLVWMEGWGDRWEAFRRERNIKAWRRDWKLRLIQDGNSAWEDLGLRPEFTAFYPEIEAGWRAAQAAAQLRI